MTDANEANANSTQVALLLEGATSTCLFLDTVTEANANQANDSANADTNTTQVALLSGGSTSTHPFLDTVTKANANKAIANAAKTNADTKAT